MISTPEDKPNSSKLPTLIVALFISLLPGAVIANTHFTNAVIYDLKVQWARNTVPSTDLSDVRIEGCTLGQCITDWNPKEYASFIKCENDKDYDRNTPVTGIDSPVSRISMYYPLDKSVDNTVIETRDRLTIGNVPVFNFEDMYEELGKNYILMDQWRLNYWRENRYLVFIDRQNNLELRFGYENDAFYNLTMMRPDNRGVIAYLMNKQIPSKPGYYRNIKENRILETFHIRTVLERLYVTFRDKEFLYPLDVYLSILLYFSAWTFPLIYVRYKPHLAPCLAAFAWYVVWCCFCAMTLIAQR